MFAVVEETQRAPATGGVVDDLSHHRTILLEEQLVADTYLTGRLDKHVPQAQLRVELAQQEHLNLGIGLLLGAIKTGGEHLGVVEDEGIALVEEIHQVAERQVLIGIVAIGVFLEHLYGLAFAVNDHQSRLVAVIDTLHRSVLVLESAMRWVECDLLFRQFESEL